MAEDIVRIVREEFGRGNEFCQKITYKVTAAKPKDLIQSFRNSYNPRIVVTVDLIATGTVAIASSRSYGATVRSSATMASAIRTTWSSSRSCSS